MKRFIAMLVALVLAVTLATFAPAGATTTDKVGVCHRTGSETNPYVYIEVPADKANGHITGDSKQHNHSVTWNTDGTWNGVPHKAGDERLDYYANEEDKATNCGERTPPPHDECPDLSGNQPVGTDCDAPAPERETRSTTVTDCEADTVTTTHEERTRSYVWDGDSFEPTAWSAWTVYDTDVRAANDTECPPDEEEPVKVVPVAPTFVDKCGTANDRVVLPEDDQTEIGYNVVRNGLVAEVTAYDANLNDNFVIDPAAQTVWNFTFTDKACPVDTAPKAVIKWRTIDGCETRDDVWITFRKNVEKASVKRVAPTKFVIRAVAKSVFVDRLGGEKVFRKVIKTTNTQKGCVGS